MVGWIILGIVILLTIICLIRTLSVKSLRGSGEPLELDVKDGRYAESLSQMIKIPTVSVSGQPTAHIDEFHKLLKKLYPNIHKNLELTNLDDSLLYYWKGADSSLQPLCFMAHQDVVEAQGEWEHGPFDGDIADGKVWGRGAVDIKCALCGIMEAVEELIADGYKPKRDIYLSFGRNEEVNGDGAQRAAAYFREKGIKLEMVLDEGGMILEKPPFPGISGKYAVIGILEKGYGDVKLTARSSGGHSSTPPKNTPIARLAKFITRMENRSPFKVKLTKPVKQMLVSCAPDVPFALRYMFMNLWLFGPLLRLVLNKISPLSSAMLHTTCAFTTMKGSNGYNVLPESAYVTANLRFMPHQNKDESLEIVKRIAAKYDIEAEWIHGNPASSISDISARPFSYLRESIVRAFPETGVTPYVILGGTDSRYFTGLSDSVLRFSPYTATPQQVSSCHGKNENIDIKSLNEGIAFYRYFISHYDA